MTHLLGGWGANPVRARLVAAAARLTALAMCVAVGAFGVTALLGEVHTSPWFIFINWILLAVGLYAAAVGIDVALLVRDWKTVVLVVVVGVAMKAAIIAGGLWLLRQDQELIVLGVVMAQIDPLGTAALKKAGRMSARAQNLVLAWSSLDDPVTVLAFLFLFAASSDVQSGSQEGPLSLVTALVLIGVVALMTWVTKRVASLPRRPLGLTEPTRRQRLLAIPALAVGFLLAVLRGAMLTVVGMGLFVRPWSDRGVDCVTQAALFLAATSLGILIAAARGGQEELILGVTLGFLTYGSQIAAALLLTRKLPRQDRWHLGFAHVSGITAILLGVFASRSDPAIALVVGVAIATVLVLHTVVNTAWDVCRTSPAK